MRILVVEDEAVLREGLCDLLTGDGHAVEAAADGVQALARGTEAPFELIVLDVMLPRLSGFEVASRLRRVRPALPILMLTARGAEDDKLRGLDQGADDYVTKPFSPRELLARVRALGRRAAPPAPECFAADGCQFDLGRLSATRDLAVELTAREAGILRCLQGRAGQVVTRAELLERVWRVSGRMQTRTVDMAIANLRKKIERDPAQPRIVLSRKGLGYAWGG